MITIAGRQLASARLTNISPLDRPWRTIIFLLPVLIFTFYSWLLLRNLNRGVTLAIPKTGFPVLKIFPGKVKLISKYRIQHYDNPLITGFLGLLFFAAAEFFIVIMFKTASYTFI